MSATVAPLSADANGDVTVVVEMASDPVAVVQAEKGRDLTKAERSAIKKSLEQEQQPVVGAVEAEGGAVEATMQSAYNGVQATIPADAVDTVAALPGVVGIHAARTYTIDNAVSVPFLGVPQVWQSTGYTGENVKVAIIDTGIDFTHANFGGPGTVEAYEAANAAETQPADPALFGPAAPRVKGGWDFVGDDYNANEDDSVPQPDPNPLDCNGHGSHVAGTTGGNGVTADGATYAGPYDESTATKQWKIGPGVAPEVDLYALRVFGCDGSTNVTVAAIDWAVANDMDVINMSLGSSYGGPDDPEAVASANAIGAGVVVVASAGNAGPSPYIAGSPGTGEGVVSVAAVDSTESFPGALITVNGVGKPAINANGADLSGIPPLTVVRLVDNPATPVNEALGCSAAAYTAAGVTPGGNQLAVSTRGDCARVSKAIYAQMAGAAAALMVNNTNDYPPFEGVITENADTGEPYDVTIPFLGVRASDGPAFVTGAPATVAAADLDNPGFRGYASFSSNGPRSGDSGVAVDVAAPGVSIVSTGVGTGNGPATISGTSMAAPHVAGVAALTVQSHPGWKAGEIAAAVVSSADPDKVAGQQLTRGGVGLVDAAQAVATKVTATGDAFRTDSGWLRESALNFGFQESWLGFAGLKTITLTNHGDSAVTYKVSSAPSAQSEKAKLTFNRSSVKVPAKGKATVIVGLTAAAGAVGSSSVAGDPFALYEFSGDVVLTSDSSTLRVPYLLVPRSDSRVASSTSALFGKKESVATAEKSLKLTNKLGALTAAADFYTWGLSDAKDVPKAISDTGFDLASAGVQSFDVGGGDQLLVFAVNTHKRWSNPASLEFDVVIDRNGDGKPEAIVFSADSGLVNTGSVNGRSEVFISTAAGLFAAGFYASAPTDSSTILLPVYASDLGLTSSAGSFGYSVASYSLTDSAGFDEIDGVAGYNPWSPAIENGQYVEVPRNGSVTVPVAVDGAAFTAQKPLGVMAVVIDNKSGKSETVLVKAK
ncbi:S8 family peptidase [Microbacterium sp. CFBP9034]|uniref:S8 family peptidase n=1 Tax=Microbacterium sp. CFBP9034 TaxID=3096540 RepID=UPI002A6B195C|nr:S8 family serine peptidase [Microbacterium sp. CFBP9034]MDY0910483.1 S8 family serine peptidase [Microbacterium sp. CFBP9034]